MPSLKFKSWTESSQHGILQDLDFLYICSYVELLTVTKFAPQILSHFRRKSTNGWSIATVFSDLIGGSFSILQMVVISCNENDWTSFIGDPTKFGAGLLSVLFDILFILQHYVFYRQTPNQSVPWYLIYHLSGYQVDLKFF